ncbi:MAG TPA: ASKHA domain-containing protein, partial [Thermoleophilia bacterium]|nr:ASKHA domain-containing protein [Thermoleophilia bacterium]
FKVIGADEWSVDRPPGSIGARGICGSGIIEAAAEMLKAGVILPTGNLNPELHHERMIVEDGKPRKFVIAWPGETALDRAITVSQKDIRAIQLAKAALRAGAEILLSTYGIEKPDRVILAGAFGTYIDKNAALAIGMLPECEPDRVLSVGNAAGDGARFALLSLEKRSEASWVADVVEYVELATDPDFQREYVEAMHFPPPVPPVPGVARPA